MSAAKKASASPAEIGFSTALAELEGILERVDSDEVDIDELAVELGKAASLLEICRSKIRRAEVEVSQIVQRLEASEPPATEEPGSDGSDDSDDPDDGDDRDG
jgi:exodeoxyribonuclease VII small subunit